MLCKWYVGQCDCSGEGAVCTMLYKWYVIVQVKELYGVVSVVCDCTGEGAVQCCISGI